VPDIKLFYSLTPAAFARELVEAGLPSFRAKQVFGWVYQRGVTDWSRMSDLPAKLRSDFAERYDLSLPPILRMLGSRDTTRKYLLGLRAGDAVESVLIPASPALYGSRSDRRTLCISTQVGCAYGCKFCASGLDGWKRNLEPGEIVTQVLAVQAASGERVNNIVFMGMGEPLANYDNLLAAIDILNSPECVGIGARHITVSTSGLAPRIRDLALQPRQIRLAVSLHGATDDIRSAIMPVNKKYPLAELLDACRFYCSQKKQFLTFEYILIEGINDSAAAARALAKVSKGLRAKVNLIPYNRVEGLDWKRPSHEVQEAFLRILREAGVPATLRREKGHDINAACGQLRLNTLRKNQGGLSLTDQAMWNAGAEISESER